MRMSSPELSRLKILSFAALFVAIASTAFLSVLIVQISAISSLHTTTTSSPASSTMTSQSIGQLVSPSIVAELTGVSSKTLSAVGRGPSDVTSPAPVTNSQPLVSSGKPEVLYIGGEFCPFCAAERWPLIIALSRFGNFSGLEYMQSSSTDAYPNTSTFTLANATFTSGYISFVPVESQNRTGATVRPLTSNQSALFKQFDSSASIPFIDFGNSYVLVGSQYLPIVLRMGGTAQGAPYDWISIASQLDTANATIAQSIDGAANRLISAICSITGGMPQAVCSQAFAMTLGVFLANPSTKADSYFEARRITPAASRTV